MLEDDLKYCPKCRDEYRVEMETCVTCNISLILGAKLREMERDNRGGSSRNRKGPLTSDDNLVVIFQAPLADLKHLMDLLEADQLAAMISKDDKGCGGGCTPNFLLLVREEEARDALEILAEEHRRATVLAEHDATHAEAVFNPEAEKAVCPACGFAFATTTTTCPDCGLCFG